MKLILPSRPNFPLVFVLFSHLSKATLFSQVAPSLATKAHPHDPWPAPKSPLSGRPDNKHKYLGKTTTQSLSSVFRCMIVRLFSPCNPIQDWASPGNKIIKNRWSRNDATCWHMTEETSPSSPNVDFWNSVFFFFPFVGPLSLRARSGLFASLKWPPPSHAFWLRWRSDNNGLSFWKAAPVPPHVWTRKPDYQ